MKNRMFGMLLLCACFAVVMGGCATEAKMSTEEKQNFKGGPMPPEAAAKMAKAMQESAQRAKQNAASPAATK